MTWQKVANLSEVPENGLAKFATSSGEILLIRMGERLFATQPNCTHESDDLSGGSLEDGKLVCGFHYAAFDPATGEALGQPQDGGAATALRTYAVRTENGDVLVDA